MLFAQGGLVASAGGAELPVDEIRGVQRLDSVPGGKRPECFFSDERGGIVHPQLGAWTSAFDQRPNSLKATSPIRRSPRVDARNRFLSQGISLATRLVWSQGERAAG